MERAETAPPEAPAKRGALARAAAALDRVLRRAFFRLGYAIAGHPWKTVLLALLFTAACLAGMLRFRTESREEELWVPQGTVALKNFAFVVPRFGRTVRTSSIVFRGGGAANGLASQAAMLKMVEVARTGFAVVTKGDNGDVTFAERCINSTDTQGNVACKTTSPLDLFYDTDNVVLLNGRVDFFETVQKGVLNASDAQVRAKLENPPALVWDNSPFNKDEILGGVSGSGDSFRVGAAKYTQLVENRGVVDGGALVDDDSDELERVWTEKLLDDGSLKKDSNIEWFIDSTYSAGQSLETALSGDLPLLGFGFVLLFFFVIFYLGDFHTVRSRMILGIFVLLIAGLAMGATFGLSSAIGWFYGPVHQILPLLLISLGVDDIFVVTKALDDINQDERNKDKPTRLRIALALSGAGTAITITSATNVIVFASGAVSKLPALRFFALWAAIGVALDWLYSITLYIAALTLDQRRIAAKRRDCFPCFPPVKEVKELSWFKKPAGGFSRFFGNTLGPLILKPVVRIVILIFFSALLAVCAWGASRLYLLFQFAFFFPKGSPQREYQDVVDENFKLGNSINVYLSGTDLSSKKNQEQYLNLCKPLTGVIASNEWMQNDTIDCWYVAMRSADEEIQSDGDFFDPATFHQKARDFVSSGPGQRYENDVYFENDQVESCKFAAQYKYLATNDEEIDSLESVRAAADSVGFGADEDGNPKAFPYGFSDQFTEQYRALPTEIALSLGLASVAVGLVCTFLIGNLFVAAISMVIVGMTIVGVLGFVNFLGVNISSVSVITLVISTG